MFGWHKLSIGAGAGDDSVARLKGRRHQRRLVALLGVFSFVGCAAAPVGSAPLVVMYPTDSSVIISDASEPSATARPPISKPYVPSYPNAKTPLVAYDGVVENLFFHPVVAYPELAFNGNSETKGIDTSMVTVSEFDKMLQSIYDNNYILVNWNDVWSEYTDSNGVQRMRKNTLYLPIGKKPLVINFDDVNYYPYMLKTGFTYKLIVGDDGDIWSWGLDPQGNEVVSQDLDAITILDKFVKQHPDFSMNGVKGCINLTGYAGVLGYRTQTDRSNTSPEFEANRQKEIAAVEPVIARLKQTGWYFASHTWGHIDLSTSSLSTIEDDFTRWQAEVGSLVGPTDIIVYPFGARPDGSDVTQTGPAFTYIQSLGFRIFASVGDEPFTKIKTTIDAVICDRMHPDGTTLRYARKTYLRFYDAKLVFDPSRPDYGTNW